MYFVRALARCIYLHTSRYIVIARTDTCSSDFSEFRTLGAFYEEQSAYRQIYNEDAACITHACRAFEDFNAVFLRPLLFL